MMLCTVAEVSSRSRILRALLAVVCVGTVMPSAARADTVEGLDTVTVREDGILRGDTIRVLAQAARPSETGIGIIGSMVLQQTGVRRAGTYERYGQILPVGVEYWPETFGKLIGIDETLKANEAVVSNEAAARWNVKVDDVLVIVGWKGETVDVAIGQIVPQAALQNSEIVLWDRYAKSKGWVYPDRVVLWGERANLEQIMETSKMPVNARPDNRFKNVRVEASWGPLDPNTPMKIAELKAMVGEYKYLQAGRAVMEIDKAWLKKLQPVTAGGVTVYCAAGMAPRINAAFAKMTAAGLTSALDMTQTRKHGGCFRAVEKTADYYLRTMRPSVRAWGTSYELRMKLVGKGCDVVRAWRAAGWAWVSTGPRSLVFQYTGRTSTGFFSPKCK